MRPVFSNSNREWGLKIVTNSLCLKKKKVSGDLKKKKKIPFFLSRNLGRTGIEIIQENPHTLSTGPRRPRTSGKDQNQRGVLLAELHEWNK